MQFLGSFLGFYMSALWRKAISVPKQQATTKLVFLPDGKMEIYRQELLDFLALPGGGVLAIKGKWGTGKTAVWDAVVQEKSSSDVNFAYSYVSLFACPTIEDLRSRVAQSALAFEMKRIGNQNERLSTALAYVQKFSSLLKGIGKKIPIEQATIAELLIQDLTVTLDDIERRSSKLELREVLGLADQLKQRHGCKVILIMNDERFNDASEKDDKIYAIYREKVVDRELRFEPSVSECFSIVYSKTDYVSFFELFERSGINNIRVHQRVLSALRAFEPFLTNISTELRTAFVRQIISIAIIHYQFADILSLDDIRGTNYVTRFLDDKESPSNTVLKNLQFFASDFDSAIISFLEDGLVDKAQMDSLLPLASRIMAKRNAEATLSILGEKLWGNFQSDQSSIVAELLIIAERHLKYLPPGSFSGLIKLIREYGADGDATRFENRYIEEVLKNLPADEIKKILDHPFDSLLDSFRAALSKRARELEGDIPLEEILKALGDPGGWSPRYYRILTRFTAEEIRNFLTTSTDVTLIDRMTRLAERLPSPPDEGTPKLIVTLKEAVLPISEQSPLNARRLRDFMQHLTKKETEFKNAPSAAPRAVGGS